MRKIAFDCAQILTFSEEKKNKQKLSRPLQSLHCVYRLLKKLLETTRNEPLTYRLGVFTSSCICATVSLKYTNTSNKAATDAINLPIVGNIKPLTNHCHQMKTSICELGKKKRYFVVVKLRSDYVNRTEGSIAYTIKIFV